MAKRVVLAPGALVIIPQLSVPPSQLQAVFLVDQGVRFVFGLLAILPICEAFVDQVSIHFPSPLSLLISDRNKSLRQDRVFFAFAALCSPGGPKKVARK